VERLVRAGAVTLGKASMNEFAFSPSLEDDFAKPVRNPWSAAAPAGLSSGGSAAGVAAGLAMASIGSDSGGSIRIPSSYCGVTGLKPTYGRIGRTGVMPLSHSLDHLGVMARSAEDVALVFAAAAGHDPSDSASVDRPVPGPSQLTGRPVRGMRIGTCPRFVEAAGAQREVREALQEAAARFQSMGATLREVAIPHLAWGAAATFTLLRIEGWHAHLPALKKHWREYGRGALKQIAAGAFLSAADYLRAQQARTLIAREVAGAFAEVDLLLLPSTPQSAASGEWDRTPADSKVARSGVAYLSPFNLTGSPALALPGGFNAAGMPVGLQLIGRPFEEDAVLSAAFRFQQETRHHLRRPPLAAG
jgi:aspartyl-tRNA(Asn)/glutamyl-tRNA(Gln) amidotransferase subunit A